MLTHRTIYRAALASSHVFAWLFLFDALTTLDTTMGALGLVAALYACAYTLTFFFLPLAGFSLRTGVLRTLKLATLSYAFALFSLSAAFSNYFGTVTANAIFGTLGFVVFYALHRALYYAPYSVEASRDHHAHSRWIEVMLALLPSFAGFSVIVFGYEAILGVGILLVILAVIPLTRLAERYEKYEWTYGESFRALIVPSHARLVVGAIADGVQSAGLLFFWPLLAFLLLDRSYLALGVAFSLTLLLTLLLRHLWGHKLSSRIVWSKDTIAFAGLSSWFMRLAAFSPLTVALADTVYYAATPHRVYAIDPFTLTQSPDGGSYIDELTTLKEMGHALGKILIAMMTGGALFSDSPYLFFGLALTCAALGSLVSMYLVRSEK